jgi:hypothetical protein
LRTPFIGHSSILTSAASVAHAVVGGNLLNEKLQSSVPSSTEGAPYFIAPVLKLSPKKPPTLQPGKAAEKGALRSSISEMIISIIKSFHAALARQENAAHDRKAQLRNISPSCWWTDMGR